MLSKILRTTIGLPFIIAAWPFCVFSVSVLNLVCWLYGIEVGAVEREVNHDFLCLPYSFIKKVWG